MSNQIPRDWRAQRLADMAKIGSSKRILQSEYVSEGVPFFRSKEVILRSKKQFIRDTLYISKEKFSELKKKFGAPKQDEILVTAVGTIGVIYLIEDLEFYFKDGNLLWIREIDKTVSPSYLAKYLDSDVFQTAIDRIAGGSNQAALTIEKLSELEFNIPLFAEQQKIAAILTAVDDVIESTQAQINKLKDLKTGLMQELLTQGIGHAEFKDSPVGRIPKSWEVMTLSEVTNVIDSLHQTPIFSPTGYPMVRVTDIKSGKVNLKNTVKVDALIFEEFIKKYKPVKNDLLMSRVGK
ncbi:restriction endonuclease subunit S [Iodobacter fluviatilis]|uniref:Type I restriction modification DNA specificity domain-containing protein n=1 Tax=Iodobacter fluviatilis TaxID=537 RepID=A0A7G3GFE8_9NEIS|nr:restriction endonuclease subunit S [Iodobacter fluviatilis]QBC45919.1 hypothetical protein C1H71_20480 [Iodobacter fluviatilis]